MLSHFPLPERKEKPKFTRKNFSNAFKTVQYQSLSEQTHFQFESISPKLHVNYHTAFSSKISQARSLESKLLKFHTIKSGGFNILYKGPSPSLGRGRRSEKAEIYCRERIQKIILQRKRLSALLQLKLQYTGNLKKAAAPHAETACIEPQPQPHNKSDSSSTSEIKPITQPQTDLC